MQCTTMHIHGGGGGGKPYRLLSHVHHTNKLMQTTTYHTHDIEVQRSKCFHVAVTQDYSVVGLHYVLLVSLENCYVT